ncbi:hypothetical protein D3C84_1049730 [compost metagenome]
MKYRKVTDHYRNIGHYGLLQNQAQSLGKRWNKNPVKCLVKGRRIASMARHAYSGLQTQCCNSLLEDRTRLAFT